MYNQGKNNFPSTRTSSLPERHLFQQATNLSGDTGLVLSTDAKPRLKWTPELHERFIEAVNQLGGADKATPKTVMRIMGIPGLTLYHLKSHLQKYRLSKNLYTQNNSGNNMKAAADRLSEGNGSYTSNTNPTSKNFQISGALQMQIEVQRRLHEQLEVQRHLQLRIEAQGKYLQSVLEKAQETLGGQNLGSAGLEAAKVQLSELACKVSSECLNSSFPEVTEMPGSWNQQIQAMQIADCSMDSCLTSCEGSQKEQERFRTFHANVPSCVKGTGEDTKVEENQAAGGKDLNGGKIFSLDRVIFPMPSNPTDLSMSIIDDRKSNRSMNSATRRKDRDAEGTLPEQPKTKRSAFEIENEKPLKSLGFPYLTSKLDLNANGENDEALICKRFDLNGFSWS